MKDIVHLSKKQLLVVTHHISMYAYGRHCKVNDKRGAVFVSFNFDMVVVVIQECKSSWIDQHLVQALLQYVGIVKDIFRVDYGHLFLRGLRS